MNDTIINALKWRYAVQIFNLEKKVSETDLKTILESGHLSPSSFGIEPWKFIVVENPDVRAKLKEVGYGQPKITDASHLIVIAYKTHARDILAKERVERISHVTNMPVADLQPLHQMIEGSVSSKSDGELDTWIKAQAYIPLGIMIETAALLGIDSGPMEGFDANKVDEILGLSEQNFHATTMLALGYRGEDSAAKRPKVRREFSDVVTFVK